MVVLTLCGFCSSFVGLVVVLWLCICVFRLCACVRRLGHCEKRIITTMLHYHYCPHTKYCVLTHRQKYGTVSLLVSDCCSCHFSVKRPHCLNCKCTCAHLNAIGVRLFKWGLAYKKVIRRLTNRNLVWSAAFQYYSYKILFFGTSNLSIGQIDTRQRAESEPDAQPLQEDSSLSKQHFCIILKT